MLIALTKRLAGMVEHAESCAEVGIECECPSASEAREIIKEVGLLLVELDVAEKSKKMLAHALSIAMDDIASHQGSRPSPENYVWRAAEEIQHGLN